MTAKYSKRKKTLLTLGSSLLPIAVPLLAKGSYIEGGVLFLAAVSMIVAYDHFNSKGQEITVPEDVDAKTFEEAAEVLADEVPDLEKKLK